MTQLQRYQQLGDSGAASKSERDKAAADVKIIWRYSNKLRPM